MTESSTPDDVPSSRREMRAIETFVLLADSLVADYDVVDVLDQLVSTCVELFALDSAGMLLDDQAGGLAVVAASDEHSRMLEVFQVQYGEGPCGDCSRSGSPVSSADLAEESARWPRFTPVALGVGLRAVLAVPLRLRGETVGALGLFRAQPGPLLHEDQQLAQAFADVATIGILQQRSVHRSSMIAEQLRVALDSRVSIEQAKGVLAERENISMSEAFARLRRHARDTNTKLTAVATSVVRGELVLGRDMPAIADPH